MGSDNTYERATLYNEVWSEPVTAVAKRYGVSDVALRKTCKRLRIPMPPRGYWAKLKAGQQVAQAPLLPTDGPKTPMRVHSEPSKQITSSKMIDRLSFLEGKERDRVLQLCSNPEVKGRLTGLHPLIKQDQEVRTELKHKERERNKLNYWDNEYQRNRSYCTILANKLLSINVSSSDLPRAYKLLDAVFRIIEDIGGSARQNDRDGRTEVVLFGEPIHICLRSRGHDFTFTIEEYRASRKNWRDTKTKQLETELGAFVIGLLECGHILRTLREERHREEQLRLQRELERHQREQKHREEVERFHELESAALDWQKARVIEQYVVELEKQMQDETDAEKQAKLSAYISWAREKIAWLDPLIGREDSILGKRRAAVILLESE